MLARALVRKPRLLLVDEPAVVPSLGERKELYELLREGRARAQCSAPDRLGGHRAPRMGPMCSCQIGGGELVRVGGEPAKVVPFPPRHSPRQPGGMERSGS